MGGGFFASSKDVRLSGSVLFATCISQDGQSHNSSVDLNAILGNDNGHFVHPGKEALNSAKGFGLSGSVLNATLLNSLHIGIPAQINLDDFISNTDGRLDVDA